MKRSGHENVKFFIGDEVEVTPAHGQKTLFVVGVQSVEEIEKVLDDPYTKINREITHIYFGANQSFPKLDVNDYELWDIWEKMIVYFLKKKYICTLDFDVGCVTGVLESPLVEYSNFIPMISVKIPYIEQLRYNAVVKLDDRDFVATNPGVWCHQLHDLMKRSQFTPWHCYTKDEVIK